MTDDRPPAERFRFRPVAPDDLPLLGRWRSAEHVARWWGEPGDLAAEYISGTGPERYFIALLDGRPVGLVQHYHWADFPTEAAVIGAGEDEDGIDYFLGQPELLGAGLGPAMLQAFLAQVVTADRTPGGVRIDVAQANRRSWRCLEKLGFQRAREGVSVADEPGPHYVYALRFQGPKKSLTPLRRRGLEQKLSLSDTNLPNPPGRRGVSDAVASRSLRPGSQH